MYFVGPEDASEYAVAPLLDHALIIHANAHDRDQRLTGRYHNTTLNTNKSHTSFILQARGLEGSNTQARVTQESAEASVSEYRHN